LNLMNRSWMVADTIGFSRMEFQFSTFRTFFSERNRPETETPRG
jgi:hypothetical protein